MARITVEEALEKVSTRYELIILAAKRARQLATGGRRPTLEWEDDKPTVMALREIEAGTVTTDNICLLYTSPSPRDRTRSRMPSSA